MKKNLVFAIVLVSMFVGITSAWAGGVGLVDSERVARGFLNHDVAFYTGDFGFTRVYVNGATMEVHGNFELQLDGMVSFLDIDGQTIVARDDDPIGGLPPNTEGLTTNFWLYLSAYDETGGTFISGNFYADLLKMNDPITVALRLNWDYVLVPYVIPEGVNANDLRLRVGRNDFCFDPYYGGFHVWFDTTEPATFDILNPLTGVIYDRGSMDDFRTDKTAENVVSFQYPTGTAKLIPDGQTWVQLENVPLDGQVVRDGVGVPAKVFFLKTYGQDTYIYVNSQSGKTIEVREWRPIGEEMPLIYEADLDYVSDGGYPPFRKDLNIPAGYGRVVITILGNEDTVAGDTFYIHAGGGKG